MSRGPSGPRALDSRERRAPRKAAHRAPAPPERALVAVTITILAVAGAALMAPSCTYPDFRYEETDDGEGGDGPSSSSSSSGLVAEVPCGVDGLECKPGQVCCFHMIDETQDHCGASMTCGLDYNEFSCNTSEDCPPQASICCGKDNDGDAILDVISCQANCASVSEVVMCAGAAECPSMECAELVLDYPGYRFCTQLM